MSLHRQALFGPGQVNEVPYRTASERQPRLLTDVYGANNIYAPHSRMRPTRVYNVPQQPGAPSMTSRAYNLPEYLKHPRQPYYQEPVQLPAGAMLALPVGAYAQEPAYMQEPDNSQLPGFTQDRVYAPEPPTYLPVRQIQRHAAPPEQDLATGDDAPQQQAVYVNPPLQQQDTAGLPPGLEAMAELPPAMYEYLAEVVKRAVQEGGEDPLQRVGQLLCAAAGSTEELETEREIELADTTERQADEIEKLQAHVQRQEECIKKQDEYIQQVEAARLDIEAAAAQVEQQRADIQAYVEQVEQRHKEEMEAAEAEGSARDDPDSAQAEQSEIVEKLQARIARQDGQLAEIGRQNAESAQAIHLLRSQLAETQRQHEMSKTRTTHLLEQIAKLEGENEKMYIESMDHDSVVEDFDRRIKRLLDVWSTRLNIEQRKRILYQSFLAWLHILPQVAQSRKNVLSRRGSVNMGFRRPSLPASEGLSEESSFLRRHSSDSAYADA